MLCLKPKNDKALKYSPVYLPVVHSGKIQLFYGGFLLLPHHTHTTYFLSHFTTTKFYVSYQDFFFVRSKQQHMIVKGREEDRWFPKISTGKILNSITCTGIKPLG
ncbi:hypothetical protein GOODEAATRI_013394 [Goodea atripinnis]|uniref:Uncharacterized protein n=1 Tax=Goodea atripinnis TaxID=208336 RepID=A0ABV0PNX9_9TELE